MICLPVTDSSHVAEARRTITQLGSSIGLDESACARAALVATELATNLLKHGQGGTLIASNDEYTDTPALQILALDRGKGMQNVDQCMQDGYSTLGSPGTGLGAIKRQAHAFEVFSQPDLGTAIYARVQLGRLPAQSSMCPFGAVCLPKGGEIANGDAWAVTGPPGNRTYLIVDGLGHGFHAAEAAQAAVEEFRRTSALATPTTMLTAIHQALRPTRGAAVAVARVDEQNDQLIFAGVGNIAGTIISGGESRKTISRNGTAGHQVRRFQEYPYPFPRGSYLVMHSDGLMSNWSLDRYTGLLARGPMLIAGVLYRDYRRDRDDVTVLTATRELS